MKRHIWRNEIIPIAWLWLASVIIGVAAAASVKADPAQDFASEHAADICIALDYTPTMTGLLAVMAGVKAAGLTDHDTGEAVAESIIYICPQHTPLLRQFVADYGKRNNPGVIA